MMSAALYTSLPTDEKSKPIMPIHLEVALMSLRGIALSLFLKTHPTLNEEILSLEIDQEHADTPGVTVLAYALNVLKDQDLKIFLSYCPKKFSSALLEKRFASRPSALYTSIYRLAPEDFQDFLKRCPEQFSLSGLTALTAFKSSDASSSFYTAPLNLLFRIRSTKEILYFLQKCQVILNFKNFKAVFLAQFADPHKTHDYDIGKMKISLFAMYIYLSDKLAHKQKDAQLRIDDFHQLLEAMQANTYLPCSSIRPGFFSANYHELRNKIIELYRRNPTNMRKLINSSLTDLLPPPSSPEIIKTVIGASVELTVFKRHIPTKCAMPDLRL